LALFVLVHGSWHDGTCWNGAIAHWEGKGHKTFAPTIAGHGKGVDKNVDHSQSTKSIVDHIVERALEGLVLVAHSFGGTIISKVAGAIPGRIRRIVFLNGLVVRDGLSLLDEIPPHHASLFKQLAMESSDSSVTLPFPIWRDAFVNDADLGLAKCLRAALSGTLATDQGQVGSEEVLFAGHSEELHQLYRGHGAPAGRMRLASSHVWPARALPARANARRS
jgi:pimeloyl-ACP methyl ester carboxylesterase